MLFIIAEGRVRNDGFAYPDPESLLSLFFGRGTDVDGKIADLSGPALFTLFHKVHRLSGNDALNVLAVCVSHKNS